MVMPFTTIRNFGEVLFARSNAPAADQARLAAVVEIAQTVFGDDEDGLTLFMNRPNLALGGVSPISEILRSDEGAEHVKRVLQTVIDGHPA